MSEKTKTQDGGLRELRAWAQAKADECMAGKRPTIARRHFAQAFLTVVEKCSRMLDAHSIAAIRE